MDELRTHVQAPLSEKIYEESSALPCFGSFEQEIESEREVWWDPVGSGHHLQALSGDGPYDRKLPQVPFP